MKPVSRRAQTALMSKRRCHEKSRGRAGAKLSYNDGWSIRVSRDERSSETDAIPSLQPLNHIATMRTMIEEARHVA